MREDLSQLNLKIRKEADSILYTQGLKLILDDYGTAHVSGSYELNLMTWRDLDIYLESNISEEQFFEMGNKLAQLLKPVKISFRNERIARTKGLPNGLYWGIYLGNERAGSWKIDIWAVDTKELESLLEYRNKIKNRLTETTRKRILDIKSQCWQNPKYRKSFTSTDIYDAVLDDCISCYDEFQLYIKGRAKNI